MAMALGRGAVDAPLLDLGAGARRLAVAATEPYSTQILRATRSVHFQVGTLCTMLLEAAHVDRRQGIGCRAHRPRPRSSAPRDRPGPSCRRSTTGRFEVRRRHERPHAVGAADLHAHQRAEAAADDGAPSPTTARASVRLSVSRSWPTSGAPMLATRADPVVVGEVGRRP